MIDDNGIQLVSIPDCGARGPVLDCLSIPSDPCALCPDPCLGVDCGAHGSCSGGTCTCESGAYTGDRCQTFGAGGSLVGSLLVVLVTLRSHLLSLRLRSVIRSSSISVELTSRAPYRCADPCVGIDCGAHGLCSGGSCTCKIGYTGDRCQSFDPCFEIDCTPAVAPAPAGSTASMATVSVVVAAVVPAAMVLCYM